MKKKQGQQMALLFLLPLVTITSRSMALKEET
jgi:hypothetical protein